MQPAPAFFNFRCVMSPSKKKTGGFMTTPTIRSAFKLGTPRSPRAVRDLLMISSFGFWAVLLGLVPVLAFHGLIGR